MTNEFPSKGRCAKQPSPLFLGEDMYKKELVTVLREAARKIKSGEEYSWGDPARCNCGFLTQVALDILPNPLTLKLKQQGMYGSWTESANTYCPTTGIPLTAIFKQLAELGLTTEDFEHLEHLSDPSVQKAAGLNFEGLGGYIESFGNPAHVVKYMRAWAEQIEQKLQTQVAKKKAKSRLHRLAKSVLADASTPLPSVAHKKATAKRHKKTVKRRMTR